MSVNENPFLQGLIEKIRDRITLYRQKGASKFQILFSHGVGVGEPLLVLRLELLIGKTEVG